MWKLKKGVKMKIIVYVLKETEVSNAVILCYKDYKKARDTYDELVKERFGQNMQGASNICMESRRSISL